MLFTVGQRVSYPNHGVGTIEKIEEKQSGSCAANFYSLRLLENNSVVFIPVDRAENIGVRPVISSYQCDKVLRFLAEDFENCARDWKERYRTFSDKMQSGCIFDAAEVLKVLWFLSREKSLSFREQRMFDKARYLVVSELATVCSQPECRVQDKVEQLIGKALEKHLGAAVADVRVMTATVH
jgi:CarD family transcriptional regulator